MSWSCLSNPTTPARERSRGFTLIELMMVVAIIGVMSAVAIGAYTKNIRKARKTQVIANLSKLALREAAVFSLRGHYASTTTGESVTDIYPAAGAFDDPANREAPKWDPGSESYKGGNLTGPYAFLGPTEHGFDILSFMPDGGRTRCGYGVIAGLGSLGRLPNGEPASIEPPFALPLAGQIWSPDRASLYARDWFYAFARCDFDKDGGAWGVGRTWDFTLTNLDSNVVANDDGAV